MYTMVDTIFLEWIKQEMKKHGMNQSQLAKKGGISRSAINKLLMQQQKRAGPDLCKALAKGFSLPQEEVFRRAGLLPEIKNSDQDSDQLYELAKQLSEENKLLLLDIALNMAERQGRKNAIPRYQRSASQNLAVAEQKKQKTS